MLNKTDFLLKKEYIFFSVKLMMQTGCNDPQIADNDTTTARHLLKINALERFPDLLLLKQDDSSIGKIHQQKRPGISQQSFFASPY